MLLGLTGAPKTFQKAMDNLFSKLPIVKVDLDYIIIFSSDFETHLEDIAVVLGKLDKKNIKINSEKCEFKKEKIRFLGKIISKNHIHNQF